MQALLKKEPEEPDHEIVDIVTVTPPCHRLKEVKEEEPEVDPEPKFFLAPCPSAQFVSETAQQVWFSVGLLECTLYSIPHFLAQGGFGVYCFIKTFPNDLLCPFNLQTPPPPSSFRSAWPSSRWR